MDAVNWQKLRLSIDPNLVDIRKPSVRGINCKETHLNDTHEKINQNHGDMESNQNTAHIVDGNLKSYQNAHDNIFVVALLSVMCGVMLAFFILFVILNREKIYNRFSGTTVMYSTNKILPQTGEYANAELLIR